MAGATADKPRSSSTRDALSEYEVELRKKSAILSGGRTQSNAGATREPLIAPRSDLGWDGSDNPHSATDDASVPPPFESAPVVRIQPKTNPAPLFEPVEGFGPANDFGPSDNVPIPAWPSTNGNPAGDTGPVIRPRSSN